MIFTEDLLKVIIKDYFNQDNIKNYIYYDQNFFIALTLLLNNMVSKYYIDNCMIFFGNHIYIDMNRLLDQHDHFLEIQPLIYFLYEIMCKMNLLNHYINITDINLWEELSKHKEFNFLFTLINNLKVDNISDMLNVLKI
uniref:Uncharacterized protein n=1 Tax=viral metagenome TaxID=1070528 RepID=A0A6C0DA77_9ZZZZ